MLSSIGGPLRHLSRSIYSPIQFYTTGCRQFHSTPRLLHTNHKDFPTPTPPEALHLPKDTQPPAADSPPPSDAQFFAALENTRWADEAKPPSPTNPQAKGKGRGGRRFRDSNGVDMVKKMHEEEIIQKFQRRGDWDKPEVREQMNRVLAERRMRGGEESGNQTYKVGEYRVSIENTDADVLREQREGDDKAAAKKLGEIVEPPEEIVVVDKDPDLVNTLLDRPSKADSRVAAMQGKEHFEFGNEKELEEFEEGKGSPPSKKGTLREAKIQQKRVRGPSIKKNEFGADQLTLLYDEQPPLDKPIVRYKNPLKQLKYLPIYPNKVKRWVTYMRHPKGRYNKWGYWKNDPEAQEQEDERKEELKIRARERGDNGMALMAEKEKKKYLPLDLEGHYRFGVQPDELIGIHPKVKELLSFKHANNPEIHAFRKQQLVKRWQERPGDHGTSQVQIAMMTNRIEYMTEHLKKHRKDHATSFRLRLLLSKRQALLNYIRKKNVPVYFQLVKELNIKDHSF